MDTTDEPFDGPPPFRYGDRVRDKERQNEETLIVIACPDATCDEWNIPTGETVAEDNPDYLPTAPVAVAMFEDELNEYLPSWQDRGGPLRLSKVAANGGRYYSFPEPRLELIDPAENVLNTVGIAGPTFNTNGDNGTT